MAVDQFYSTPDASGLQYPDDVIHNKQGTASSLTVMPIATAGPLWTQTSDSVPWRRYSVASAPIAGKGVCPAPTSSEPYGRLALKDELTFGGSIVDGNRIVKTYSGDPAGIGYITGNADGHLLPHIEYRKQLISSQRDCPRSRRPQRRSKTLAAMQPLCRNLREGLDDIPAPPTAARRFHNAVAEDQIVGAGLQRGEELTLHNIHPRVPVLRITLPRPSPRATLRIDRKSRPLPMVTDTLRVEPDENILTMSFRCTCPMAMEPAERPSDELKETIATLASKRKALQKAQAWFQKEANVFSLERFLRLPRIARDRILGGTGRVSPFIYQVAVNKDTGAYPRDDVFVEANGEAQSSQMGVAGAFSESQVALLQH